MREVLCRGKRINRNEWYEGFYCELPCEDGSKVPSILFVDEEKNVMIQMPIAPETVSRWTGLNGKNGKRIFEGDIVITTILSPVVRTVEWRTNDAAFVVVDDNGTWDYLRAYTSITGFNVHFLEVIGNKWDNPELLGV